MKMLLVGIGQETTLGSLDQTRNFLTFEREDGVEFRISVTQDVVREVLLASTSQGPQRVKEAQEETSSPDESDAAEFGGDFYEKDPDEDSSFEPHEEPEGGPAFQVEPPEQYASEDDVPQL